MNVCSHTFVLPFFKDPLASACKGGVSSDHLDTFLYLFKPVVNSSFSLKILVKIYEKMQIFADPANVDFGTFGNKICKTLKSG